MACISDVLWGPTDPSSPYTCTIVLPNIHLVQCHSYGSTSPRYYGILHSLTLLRWCLPLSASKQKSRSDRGLNPDHSIRTGRGHHYTIPPELRYEFNSQLGFNIRARTSLKPGRNLKNRCSSFFHRFHSVSTVTASPEFCGPRAVNM